jgi:large subunit ribosomal protein L9
MKIILLKDIPKVGKMHEIKEVSSGHAINLLIPNGAAIAATPEAMKRTEAMRTKAEGDRKVHEDLLVKNLKDLDGTTLTVSGKANGKGHLFAGLHKDEIVAELLKQTGLQINPEMIQLEHAVKEVGEHMIEVKAEGLPAGQAGKSVKFKLIVTAV